MIYALRQSDSERLGFACIELKEDLSESIPELFVWNCRRRYLA